MPTNIIETATKGSTISVPVGTDKRKASSLTAAWQAIGDRLKFLENFYDALVVLLSGGSFTTTDDLDWTIATTKRIKIKTPSLSSGYMDLAELKKIVFDRNVEGPMFQVGAGFYGRANRKPVAIAPGAGVTDVDPHTYNTVFANPSASGSLKITPSQTIAEGDWIEVVGESTSFTVTVLDPASGAIPGDGTSLRSANGSHRSAVYVYVSGGWRAIPTPYQA